MNPFNSFDHQTVAKKARIEIIPLIDVVFFLLATFVLFTLSLDKIRSLTVQLPYPGKVESTEDTTAYIQCSEPGTFYWKEGRLGPPQLISGSELQLRLEEYKQRVPNSRVFIRGDSKAKFGATVMLYDEVRRAGIDQVSIETMVSASGN